MLLTYWRNDTDGGTTFSAAIDNISITPADSTPTPPESYTVALTSSNPQRGTALGAGQYTPGSTADIIAAPKFGYAFNGWSDNVNDNPRQLTVSSDTSLIANFILFDTTYTPDTVHDTIYHNLYHHDTITLHDTLRDTIRTTLYRTDTIEIHDTVNTTCYRTDTLWLTDTLLDTLRLHYYHTDTLELHDTTYIDYYHTDTIELHDTINIATEVHDTIRFVRTDTIIQERIVYDTLVYTRLDTVVQTIIQYDTLTFTDTAYIVTTDTVHDTIYVTVYDTIYMQDTTGLSLDPVEAIQPHVYTESNYIIIENAGNQAVAIFDITGRLLRSYSGQGRVKVGVTSAGTYIVRVGNRYTHRITVVK